MYQSDSSAESAGGNQGSLKDLQMGIGAVGGSKPLRVLRGEASALVDGLPRTKLGPSGRAEKMPGGGCQSSLGKVGQGDT